MAHDLANFARSGSFFALAATTAARANTLGTVIIVATHATVSVTTFYIRTCAIKSAMLLRGR
jgi:ABC-type ATPase involved in cell division